jgi:tripartite-type tricarboxylate transporter receptor subunit TctC
MIIRRLVVAALAAVLSIGAARAQDGYPSRPIRLIVPFAAGGGTDTLSRIFAQVLSEQLKGTVVVENVGGAGGSIGTGQAAKAAADGYTLVSATPSIAINPHIQKNVPYNVLRDFAPVVQITSSPAVLITNKDVPVKSVGDLIALARAKRGAISYGSAGKRSAILPELPTIADTVPGYESSSWLGLLAPVGTPRPVVERLNAAINKGLDGEAVRKRLDALGVERVGGTAEAFGAYLRAKVEETDKIAKAMGLKPE